MKILHHNLCHLLIAALSATLFGGCLKDNTDIPDSSGLITIGYTVDGMQVGTFSTAAEGHELTVNDVHILFYGMDGTSSGGYVTYQHATLTHGTSTFSFPLPDALIPKTNYRTIIVGNAHSFVPSGYATFDAYLTACKSMTFDEAKEKLFAELTGNSMSVLPMWGKFVDGSGEEIPFRFESKTSAEITGTIHLSRIVCRMDLKNYAANSLNIAWVKVCNYRSKGYYFHNDAPYGEIKAGLSSAPPSGAGDGYVRVSDPSGGIQELKAGLYAFSNIVPIVTQNDDQTTYLMIAGYYQDGSGVANTSKLTYYRFNMAELGRSQVLKRNYIYRASIMSVKGAGADSEQGAKDETSPMLEYQVDDEWNDDEDNTVTDGYGNFLLLSRTQVTFADGVKDATEVVKVKVKEGMTWEVTADHVSPGQGDAFDFAKATVSSFSVTTLLDNASEDVNSGRLKVTATTSQGTTLELRVSLMQLSSSSEMKILLVDERTGKIDRRLAGTGGMLSMPVRTGSSYAGWTAEDDGNSLSAWSGASFTRAGADKGTLNITVPANVTAAARTATILVHRVGAPDVTINLTQPVSDKLITITPMPTNGTLTIDGFSTADDSPNGLSFQKMFWVTLADPINYTITVTSSFDANHDLVLSVDKLNLNALTAKFPGTTETSTLTNLTNGSQFWLNTFRTGPGDPTIRGTITVKAVPKTLGMLEQEVLFSVNITTSCSIGDVAVAGTADTLLVADRNVGALPRIDEGGGFVSALNYSNEPNLHITGYVSPDGQNTQFKGTYQNWFLVSDASFCPTQYVDPNLDEVGVYSPYYKSADREKWHAPSEAEMKTIVSKFIYSKRRPFLLSIKKDVYGKSVGCFIPVNGNKTTPTLSTGYYWTSSSGNGRYYMRFAMGTGAVPTAPIITTILDSSPGYGARCIRKL